MRESAVEKYLKKQVEGLGGEYRRVEWLGRHGAPDDYVMLNGGHWTECKATGEEPKPHQIREHKRMQDQGIPVHILDSFEAVDNFLKIIVKASK